MEVPESGERRDVPVRGARVSPSSLATSLTPINRRSAENYERIARPRSRILTLLFAHRRPSPCSCSRESNGVLTSRLPWTASRDVVRPGRFVVSAEPRAQEAHACPRGRLPSLPRRSLRSEGKPWQLASPGPPASWARESPSSSSRASILGDVVLLTRSPEALARYSERGVVVRRADFDEPSSLVGRTHGSRPHAPDQRLSISTGEPSQHGAAIEAAKAAGVRHVLEDVDPASRGQPGSCRPVAPRDRAGASRRAGSRGRSCATTCTPSTRLPWSPRRSRAGSYVTSAGDGLDRVRLPRRLRGHGCRRARPGRSRASGVRHHRPGGHRPERAGSTCNRARWSSRAEGRAGR